MGVLIHSRLACVHFGMERFKFTLKSEVYSCTDFYVIGITFGNGKFDFQRRYFCKFGNDSSRGSIGSNTDLTQTDYTVERGTKLGLCNVSFYQVYVCIQGCQFSFYLLVGFFTDCIPLQQCILAKYAVFCQFQLGNKTLQLCL